MSYVHQQVPIVPLKQRIPEVCEGKGFSKPKLMRLTGINQRTIYKCWEDPTFIPRVETLARIGAILGYPWKDLVYESIEKA